MHQHTKKYMYITHAVEKNLKNCYLDVFVKEITPLFNIPSKYVLNEFKPWLHNLVVINCYSSRRVVRMSYSSKLCMATMALPGVAGGSRCTIIDCILIS